MQTAKVPIGHEPQRLGGEGRRRHVGPGEVVEEVLREELRLGSDVDDAVGETSPDERAVDAQPPRDGRDPGASRVDQPLEVALRVPGPEFPRFPAVHAVHAAQQFVRCHDDWTIPPGAEERARCREAPVLEGEPVLRQVFPHESRESVDQRQQVVRQHVARLFDRRAPRRQSVQDVLHAVVLSFLNGPLQHAAPPIGEPDGDSPFCRVVEQYVRAVEVLL